MSATFYERILRTGDYENDGGYIDIEEFEDLLVMYEAGEVGAALIKSRFSCTTPQADDVDDILATIPNPLLGVLVRARWAHLVAAICRSGLRGVAAYDTPAELEAELGV